MYNPGVRCGPGILLTIEKDRKVSDQHAHEKNLISALLRQVHPSHHTVPGWTGFNITVRKGLQISQDRIGYLPTTNAPATDMTTAHEILRQVKNIPDSLHLHEVVVVLDQALYVRIAEVAWKHKEKCQGIVLRLGSSHTVCNILSILGKRFQESGLEDLSSRQALLQRAPFQLPWKDGSITELCAFTNMYMKP